MFKAIGRIFRTPDLQRKIWFTLGVIALYRLGAFIPSPGVDYGNVQQCLALGNTTGGVYDLVNLFSGGALLQLSIFALGVMPYITTSSPTLLVPLSSPSWRLARVSNYPSSHIVLL